VTDRQTDGQTDGDGIAMAYTRYSCAVARNKTDEATALSAGHTLVFTAQAVLGIWPAI